MKKFKEKAGNRFNLSVIIANYNKAEYLDECLQSVFKQTYQDFEIVLIDDGSSDGSSLIMKPYLEKYPEIIRAEFNTRRKGPARTRHQGILLSRGKYITTLDSDDYYYDQHKLEKEIELVMKSDLNGNDIIAFSNILLVREDGSVIGLWGNPENIKQGKIFKEIFSRSCLIPRDMTLKKDMYWEVGGYDPRIGIYEDWDLKIRLAKKYPFLFTGCTGTAYRRHGKGLSNSALNVHRKWLKKIMKKNFHLIEKEDRNSIEQKVNIFLASIKKNP